MQSSIRSTSSYDSSLSSSESSTFVPRLDIKYNVCPDKVSFQWDKEKCCTVTLTDAHINKWKFGFNVEFAEKCKRMPDILSRIMNTTLHRESENSTCIVLKTREELNDDKAKEWREVILRELRQYTEEEIQITSANFYENTFEYANRKLHVLADKTNRVVVYFEDDIRMIHAVGTTDDLDYFNKDIITKMHQSKVITNTHRFEPHEKEITKICSLAQQLLKAYPFIEISESPDLSTFVIEGFEEDVFLVKTYITDFLNGKELLISQLDEKRTKFIKDKRYVRKYISQKLENEIETKDVKWVLDGSILKIVGPKSAKVRHTMVADRVHIHRKQLGDYECDKVFTSDRWKKARNRMNIAHKAYMELEEDLENRILVIMCTEGIREHIEREMENFNIKDKIFLGYPDFCKYLKIRGKSELEKLTNEHRTEFVKFEFEDKKLKVFGTDVGISKILITLTHRAEGQTKIVFGLANEATSRLTGETGHRILEEIGMTTTSILKLKSAPKITKDTGNIEDQMV